MKKISFHPDAEAEMIAASLYYEAHQTNLGRRFLVSMQDALNRIVANPRIYPTVEADVRRCLVKTFPFGVLFREQPEEIVVMAVMHLRRDPGYWKDRLD